MDQITYFIVGIALLLIIPLTYFCFNKVLSKKTKLGMSILIALFFIIVLAGIIFACINGYAYLVNADEKVVCERYITSLVENSNSDNYEKHLVETAYISYPELEDLEKTFDKTAKLKIDEIGTIHISQTRIIDNDLGMTHLYFYLPEQNACYDFGMFRNGSFWDVADITLLSDSKLDEVLKYERFVVYKK